MIASIARLMFSFQGRTRRSTWWATNVLVLFLLSLLFVFMDTQIGHRAPLVIFPPFFWILSALATKRLHDFGRSGWGLLWLFVPIIGPLWVFIRIGCKRGTDGENHYGDDPLAIHREYLTVNIQR